jgi:hypothetical protein
VNLETAFTLANLAVLPGWIALFGFPRWRGTPTLSGVVVPGLMALAYVGIIGVGLTRPAQGSPASLTTLAGVKALFSDDLTVLGGWVHYLAFDLVAASWEHRDSRRLGIPHAALVPCLFLTLMLGPFGFLTYLVVRGAMRRAATIPAGAS